MSGSSSRRPVVTSSRRAEIRCPSARQDPEPASAVRHQLGGGARRRCRRRSCFTSSRPTRQQLAGWEAVAGQEAVHVGGGSVARRAGVDHQDLASGPGQDQSCGQPGCAAADDRHVVLRSCGTRLGRVGVPGQRTLLFPGSGSGMGPMDGTASADETRAAIAAALDQVGPRLKRVRTQRADDPDRCRGDDRHLQEHAVPARDRTAAADPGAAPRRSRRPTGCRSTTSSVHPRWATRGSGSSPAGSRAGPSSRSPTSPTACRPGRSSSRPATSAPSREPTTATSGSTSCPATCGSSSATGTGSSGPATSPSSTPGCRTGSAAPGEEPAEILSIFGRPGERMTVRT